MQLVKAEYPTPDHVLVHISDPHFVAEGLLYGETDPQVGLVEVLDSIEASGIGPEAIILSGDLTDKGSAEAYRKLRTLGDAYAKRMGTQIIWAMGNHDERGNFQSVLLEEEPRPEPVDRRYDLGGLRVLVLDSSVPGHHHGGLTEDPPVPPVQDLAVLSELRDQEALAQVLEGSDVIGILSGHTHCTVFSTFARIPVSVASATSYTQDLALPPAAMQGRDGARSFNLVRIHNRTFVTAVVPVGAYAAFGKRITAEEARRRLRSAVEIPERGSNQTGGALSGRR
ncbi:metallophosphoesterase [Pseudarthrobacter sp. NamE5]|uniref:metallophosphoesterase n=1 Tax=Pseudarthrobacter sp. NamE5 TaxID=2576839 RepID=UPI00110A534D|nr:metallophosphoesterase [Pseudarthrobacter sp. NamE5]TLM84697.1 phosphodiesterase [Pseudarthrobacter sp. NamE5]